METDRYAGIEQATMGNRYPFFQETGNFMVKILSWKDKETRVNGWGAFLDLEIVASTNPAVRPGEHRTYMRLLKRDGSLGDMKLIAHTALSSKAGAPLDPNTITAKVVGAIADKGGEQIRGVILRTENVMTKTKAGKDFTRINWSVPTQEEVEAATRDGAAA